MDDTDDRAETTSLNNPDRIQRHDRKLWEREVRKAQEQGKRLMVCPCVRCKGGTQRLPRNVEQHLKRYGRDPSKRIVQDPYEQDSSDNEWAADWVGRMDGLGYVFADNSRGNGHEEVTGSEDHDVRANTMDTGEGINIPEMVRDIFAQYDEMRYRFDIEHEEEATTFNAAHLDEAEETGDFNSCPEQIKRASSPLYAGAKISKLGFLVMFMNIVQCHNVRHFPLIPRLIRMFHSRVLYDMMTWTAQNKSSDGKCRHIGDSPHWKWIDRRWPEFGGESRNVCLGLSLDGMNPFGDKNIQYSCWPVTILNYNIPPWQTTKKFFIIMVLLIPGPESALSSNIDVWLAPLVEELVQLWEVGVLTWDAARKETFKMKGMLILTIADYPAHGMISGQVTRGFMACTRCGKNMDKNWSKALQCCKYLGHRRFLPRGHPYRCQRRFIAQFDQKPETRLAPECITREQYIEWGEEVASLEKRQRASGRVADSEPVNGVKRRSQLDVHLTYWRVRRLLKQPHILS